MKQVSKAEFAWLHKRFFYNYDIKNKDKPWRKTCEAKGRSNRGKYYVMDKYYHMVKRQNII